jgi:hypothetical protein
MRNSTPRAGLIEHMVSLVDSDNTTTVLIATKALAVVCRNSPANQALAVERRLLDRCIALLATDLDVYMAKWVILVMNALVYENAQARPLWLCECLPVCFVFHVCSKLAAAMLLIACGFEQS